MVQMYLSPTSIPALTVGLQAHIPPSSHFDDVAEKLKLACADSMGIRPLHRPNHVDRKGLLSINIASIHPLSKLVQSVTASLATLPVQDQIL